MNETRPWRRQLAWLSLGLLLWAALAAAKLSGLLWVWRPWLPRYFLWLAPCLALMWLGYAVLWTRSWACDAAYAVVWGLAFYVLRGYLVYGDENYYPMFLEGTAGDGSDKLTLSFVHRLVQMMGPTYRSISVVVAASGVQYAKTSSGQFEGPSMKQFLIMRDTLRGSGVKLKVAGVKFPRPQNAMVFFMAGADRIGTRAAPEIVDALDTMRSLGLPGC